MNSKAVFGCSALTGITQTSGSPLRDVVAVCVGRTRQALRFEFRIRILFLARIVQHAYPSVPVRNHADPVGQEQVSHFTGVIRGKVRIQNAFLKQLVQPFINRDGRICRIWNVQLAVRRFHISLFQARALKKPCSSYMPAVLSPYVSFCRFRPDLVR